MRRILHILTDNRAHPLGEVLAHQCERTNVEVVEFDLTAETPDYAKLLEAVFEADAVSVW